MSNSSGTNEQIIQMNGAIEALVRKLNELAAL
jgi:hypothetical protein